MMGVIASAKYPKDLQTESCGGGEDETDQIGRVHKDPSRDGFAPGHLWPRMFVCMKGIVVWGRRDSIHR